MNPLKWSSVTRKLVMAVTGLAWFGFLIAHLAGNLLLLGGKDAFNAYSHKLVSLGWLLYLVEAGLLFLLIYHILSGIAVVLGRRRARPIPYQISGNAGGPSRKTLSSRTMILSGGVILVFLCVHIKTFKFGPEYPGVLPDGERVRDLYRLVDEMFGRGHELYTGFYLASFVFLGFHLRHAFWSAFQSLGLHHEKYTPMICNLGVILAMLIAAGFMMLPIWMYFARGQAT